MFEDDEGEPVMVYGKIGFSDTEEVILSDYLDDACDFLEHVKSVGGRVLVHCVVGKSRMSWQLHNLTPIRISSRDLGLFYETRISDTKRGLLQSERSAETRLPEHRLYATINENGLGVCGVDRLKLTK